MLKRNLKLIIILVIAVFLIPSYIYSDQKGGNEERTLCIGTDILGLPGYDIFGISVKKYFTEKFGIQFFISPQVFSDGFINCGVGISPIINHYRIDFNNGKQKLLSQIIFETLYILYVDQNEALFDHTISFIPSLGFEFFLFRRLSLGFKFGYGFVIQITGDGDTIWKFDLKRPDSFQNMFLHIPLHFYF